MDYSITMENVAFESSKGGEFEIEKRIIYCFCFDVVDNKCNTTGEEV